MNLVELSKPTTFRDYMKVLSIINEEVDLVFTPRGLEAKIINPDRHAMIKFSLPREAFDRWAVDDDRVITVSLADVNKILKKLGKNDMLTLDVTEETANFKMRSDITRNKKLSLLTTLDEEIPEPKIYFKSSTRMILKTFKRVLDDFKGSKNKKTVNSVHAPNDELYEEAMQQLARSEEGGTTPELQKKRTTSFNPQVRPVNRLPKNIVAGAGKAGPGQTVGSKADANVSVDEADLGDD